ncbi:hypothetical protein G7Y79_00033g068450 [Physcia stellaris]|nr:hypothetical protein G7Y79_00033g068450 [Physcia stellaris]
MKFSPHTVHLALGAFLFQGTTNAAAPGCNADNCLRALFPTASPTAVSSALAFCSTYTTTTNTATTGFPTRASAACGTAPFRYSSACSCKPSPTAPACTPVVAPNNLVQNGGFECNGLAPWTAGDIFNTAHKLSTPGEGGVGVAYEFDQTGPPAPGARIPPFLSQQIVGLTAGATYELGYSLSFDACTADTGFVGMLNSNVYIEERSTFVQFHDSPILST